jgi:chromosome segregation ATPase
MMFVSISSFRVFLLTNRIIKELEERLKGKSTELEKLTQWSSGVEAERDSLTERIRMMEETTIKGYEKTLDEKNSLLNEMSEVIEALKEQIIAAERDAKEQILAAERKASVKLQEFELAAQEQAQEAEIMATERVHQLEQVSHESSKELNNAMLQIKELQVLNDCLETECDSLRDKLSKCQEEYNVDRDKIAGALLGFDEEMTNAEAKIKSVLDELEIEKSKANELSAALEQAENHHDTLEAELKSFQARCTDLESECRSKTDQLDEWEKKQSDHEHELSVYQEAIKMLQEKVDEAFEQETANKADSSLTNSSPDNSTEVTKLQLQLDAKDCISQKNDEEISSLRQELVKERGRLGRLQKLCFNARQDLLQLRNQKSFLETSLKRSIDFIKQLKHSGNHHTENGGLVTKKSAVIGDFDRICLPLDTRAITNDNNGPGELQDFFTYIEHQVTCTDNDRDTSDQLTTTNSW